MNKAEEIIKSFEQFTLIGKVGTPKEGCEILWDPALNRVRLIPMNSKTGIVLTLNDFKRLGKTVLP